LLGEAPGLEKISDAPPPQRNQQSPDRALHSFAVLYSLVEHPCYSRHYRFLVPFFWHIVDGQSASIRHFAAFACHHGLTFFGPFEQHLTLFLVFAALAFWLNRFMYVAASVFLRALIIRSHWAFTFLHEHITIKRLNRILVRPLSNLFQKR